MAQPYLQFDFAAIAGGSVCFDDGVLLQFLSDEKNYGSAIIIAEP
ncbi:hypothetical protein [Pseudomonas sp. EL_65y_Pfl2_R96]